MSVFLSLVSCADKKTEETVKEPETVYAEFGTKIAPDNALTKEEMFEKFKGLKEGDTITVKFKSKINDVCKKKGCWMAMELPEEKEAFVKFKDYSFFVPMNATNEDAIVSGKAFISVETVDQQRHYAKDGGKSEAEISKITAPKITYAFQVDGFLITQE